MVHTPNKLTELTCLIFGHEFNETGNRRNVEFDIVEDEYKKCERCKAEFHNREGAMQVYKLKYSRNEK